MRIILRWNNWRGIGDGVRLDSNYFFIMRLLPINRLILHHSAITGNDPQYERIRQSHIKRGFGGNTAYNWVVEKSGQIRDGRVEKDYSSGTKSWICNHSGIAICLAGNFEKEEPTEHQLNALKKMIQHKMEIYGIKPKNVIGHRDCSATLCPGKNLYSKLSEMTFKPPDWANNALDWAKQEKIITKITGEPVPDYRLAVILHNFQKYIKK